MKTILFACIFLTVFAISNASAQFYNWNDSLSYYIENPAVFEQGQEEGRGYYIPNDHQSLNGDWKFFWSDIPYRLPDGFFEPKFNDKEWDNISVPSNWEMFGYGDKIFRNTHASFKVDPPHVPKEYNPTGIYRRSFNISDKWKGKEIFLRFDKVASASFVWVNGEKVGYNEGAQEPAEYNITKYLKSGQNQLTVCVIKFSDGHYLEMQDYWRLAGIFDDVTVYATNKIRLFDYQVITDLDNTYTDANIQINTVVKSYKQPVAASLYTIKAVLTDMEGQMVSQFESNSFTIPNNKISVSLKNEMKNPLKWTSETPNLYNLQLQLVTAGGETVDHIQTKIGFKETEIKGSVFYLNGIPLKIHAVNSHMQHPEQGHYMDEETIRKDFEILKQFNFNGVRTSHYPPTNKYLQLANEYGLYIIDEAGDEAHATEWLSNKTEYTGMYKERCQKMVLRDRNYPCVLFWSAGNESGEGNNISEVIKEGKRLDPTRYWMYGGNAFSHPAEDIIGPRYPTPMELEIQVGMGLGNTDNRPSFMDEYLSVAGNGGGGMDDYWNVIYSHPRLMGGAIWDFVSPGVKEPVRAVKDISPNNTPAHIMGNAKIIKEKGNAVLDLSGTDEWLEVYRRDNVEITGNELVLSCNVFPRKLISSCGSFITKGNYQFGLEQRGKEFVEFYIYTYKKYTVKAPLPPNWEYNWHQLAAVYNGKEMSIYIDGKKKAGAGASGSIKNFPFPINIGRNAEVHGQETTVYICDALLDDVAVFNKVVPLNALSAVEASCWFDFETENNNGTFYSNGIGARCYGSIWPDRKVQPEMWQMKKTVQPLSFKIIDPECGLIEVWNRNHFMNADEYQTTWALMADDQVIQQDIIDLHTKPLSKETLQISYSKPIIEAGKEYRISISSKLKHNYIWAKAGHEVAWEQLELGWSVPITKTEKASGIIQCKETGNELNVSGEGFRYTFDKKEGLLVQINFNGKDLLKEPMKLNLWRAPLANELDGWNAGNAQSGRWKTGYGNAIATEMYSAGIDKLLHQLVSFSFKESTNSVHVFIANIDLIGNGEKEKKDLYIEGIQCNGFRNEFEFIIGADGRMEIDHVILAEGRMPMWLPRVGLSLVLNKELNRINWYGRGPQENYPDRKTGYRIGIYKSSVEEMYEPYLLPQDYGLRTDNRWLRITDSDNSGIEFSMNELFNFNAYPYSTENLTKANYTYQLEKQDGVTLNLDYSTTGVGCTARAVFDSYRTMPMRYERTITINPLNP